MPSSDIGEGRQRRERPRKVIPNDNFSTFRQLPKAMPIEQYSPDFHNDLSGIQQATFPDASTVALSTDSCQFLSSGRKHREEKFTDKGHLVSVYRDGRPGI